MTKSVQELCEDQTTCVYTPPAVGTAVARIDDSVGVVVADFTGDGTGPASGIFVLNIGMGGGTNELLLPRGLCQAEIAGSSYAGDGFAARVTAQGTICCAFISLSTSCFVFVFDIDTYRGVLPQIRAHRTLLAHLAKTPAVSARRERSGLPAATTICRFEGGITPRTMRARRALLASSAARPRRLTRARPAQ